MAIPQSPAPIKLFIGFIYENHKLLEKSIQILEKKYGKIDSVGGPFPFKHTEYYSESGTDLYKYFISFEKLYKREKIAKIKLFTNKIEAKFSKNNERKINIDPGYMTLSNIFLASCKDYYHRMYMNKGVFLENELRYTKKKYIPFEWTYPDYLTEEYLQYFYKLRKIYSSNLK